MDIQWTNSTPEITPLSAVYLVCVEAQQLETHQKHEPAAVAVEAFMVVGDRFWDGSININSLSYTSTTSTCFSHQ